MIVLRMIAKVLLVPVIAVLMIVEWAASFLVAISGWIFSVISGIMFLTAVLSCLMGLSGSSETLRMLGTAFLFWSLPHVGGAMIGMAAAGRAFVQRLFLR